MPGLVHVIPRTGTDPGAPVLPIPLAWDDFDRADTEPGDLGGGWDVEAAWRILDGHACLSNSPSPAKTALVDTGRTNYRVTATLRVNAAPDRVGLAVRASDPQNFLALHRYTSGGYRWRVIHVVDGGETVLEEFALSGPVTTDAHLWVDVAGTTLTFGWNDDGERGSVTVPAATPTQTKTGLYAAKLNGAGYRFDQFAAYPAA